MSLIQMARMMIEQARMFRLAGNVKRARHRAMMAARFRVAAQNAQ